jgi:3-hydroxybutyryl-CoA dehydratase
MTDTETPAKLLRIEDVQEGQRWEETRIMSADLLARFVDVSLDVAWAHVDDAHAQRMGYEGRLVHGFLGTLAYSRILGMYLPGSNTVIHQLQLEMVAPIYVGDQITYEVKATRVIAGVKTVKLALSAVNQHGQVVNRGQATCVFRDAA